MNIKRPFLVSLVAVALFVGPAAILPSQAAPDSATPMLGLPLPPDMSQGIVDAAGITSQQQAKIQEIGNKPPTIPVLQAPPPDFGAAFLAKTVKEKELRNYFSWTMKNNPGQSQLADTVLGIRGILSSKQRDKFFAYVKTHPMPPMPKQQMQDKNPLEAQINDLLAGTSLTPQQTQKLASLKAALNKPDNMDPNVFPLAIANLIKTGKKAAFMETTKTLIAPLPVEELVQGITSLDHAQRVEIAARFEKLMAEMEKEKAEQK